MAESIKEVLFNNGEGVEETDLNLLQRMLRAQLWDSVVGHLARTSEGDVEPSTSHLYALGAGGYPKASVTAAKLDFGAGLILQRIAATDVDGDDPYLLAYELGAAEAALAALSFTANSSGNPRYDVVQVKLEHIDNDAGDNATRDIEDAATRAKTSTTFVKRRKVRLTASIVVGTPAGSPTEPAVTAGYVKLCAVLIPDGFAITDVLINTNIRDYRMPLGYGPFDVHPTTGGIPSGSDWPDLALAGRASGAASEVLHIPILGCGASQGGRVVRVGLHAHRGGAVAPTIELIRFNPFAAEASAVVVRDLTASLALGTTPSAYQEVDLSTGTPIWANGYEAGLANAVADGSTDIPYLALRITSGQNVDIVRLVRFGVAGGL